MTILLTGASGEIGKVLLKYINNKKIKCYANYRKTISNINLQNKKIIYYKKNILDNDFIIPKDVDTICHLAAILPKKYSKKIYEFNIDINKSLIKKINKSKNLRKIIFFSTVKLYSEFNSGEISEKKFLLTKDTYGKSKFYSEILFLKLKKVKVYNLRLPGILITNKNDNFLSKLIDDIYKNKKINLFNPKNYFNNAIYIDNLCDFIYNLIINDYKSGTILIGSIKPLKLEEIVKMIKNKFKSKSIINWNIIENKGFYLDINKSIKKYHFKALSITRTINKYISNVYNL
tara:strand:- start:2182 stop:3048 length:867 start_codon:yes stop_codon:yes gene_type:complete